MPTRRTNFGQSIAWTYILSLAAIVLIGGYYIYHALENQAENHLRRSLATESQIIAEAIGPSLIEKADAPKIQARVEALRAKTDARITVVAPDGQVLGESSLKNSADLALLENHGSRPEIREAIAGASGASIRLSATVRTTLLYVAVPLKDAAGRVTGVVRLAVPFSTVKRIFDYIRKPIVQSAGAGILLICLLGIFIEKRITTRIHRMTKAAERYIQDDLSGNLPIEKDDELGLLADAMNRMAASLKDKIADVENEKTKVSALLNHMAEGVIGVDRDLQVVILNPSAAHFFGISVSTAIGKSLMQVTCVPRLDEIMRRAIERSSHESASVEISFTDEKILKADAIALPENEGGIRGILVLYDNTPVYKLENMRREFVANVSHELKTPLTSIKGFVETLLGGALRDPEKAEGFLKIMQEDSERLTRLIDDLLELSKIESKGAPLKMTSENLKVEVDKVLLTLQPRFEDKKIEIKNMIPENLPKVKTDKDKLKQVLLNLLDNAIKFNKQQGRISLRASLENSMVRISVEDTGSGIPEKAVPRVFERFFRADKARGRDSGGTGLGLSIVKHIIESHGGVVECKSQPGKGSTFSFTLPLA